jgi:Uma2 family endonuclease
MSATLAPVSHRYQIPPFPVRRFTVAEYLRMIELNLLKDAEKLELLDGWITPKMTINPPHAAVLDLVREALAACAPSGWRFRVQSPITLVESVPEPDVAVAVGPASRYLTRHPGPADLSLVIEVADSSLADDRTVKGPIYAEAGIPVYWIINVVDEIVEVYTQPGPNGYAQRQDYRRGAAVPLVLGGQVVAQVPVADLIG